MPDEQLPSHFLMFPEAGEKWGDFTVLVDWRIGILLELWISVHDACEQ